MKIWTIIPRRGPGVGVNWVLSNCPDRTASEKDIREALKWAILDGHVTRVGSYYWRVGP